MFMSLIRSVHGLCVSTYNLPLDIIVMALDLSKVAVL